MLLLLGPSVGCCRVGSGSSRQLTGQRTFDPERFLRWNSPEKAALGSGECGLPVINRHFQHLISLSLSLRPAWVFICVCLLVEGGQAGVWGPPCPPCLPRVGWGRSATSCGLHIQQGSEQSCAPHGCGLGSLLYTALGWQPWHQHG